MILPVVVDQFSQVVAAVSAEYGQTVYFRHGHMLEIASIVQDMMKDPDIDKRYPIIALQHDFEQDPIPYQGTELSDLTMYIITLTRPEYTSEMRKELIFKPILYQIRDIFIEQIARSGYFEQRSVDQVHEVITLFDRYYWGSSTVMGNKGNILGEWTDCIEINFNGLISFGAACGEAITYPRLVNALTCLTGETIFINFDTVMANPTGLHSNIFYGEVGSLTFPDAVSLSNDGKTFICTLPPDELQPNIDLVLTIAGGVFETTEGIELKPITEAYIQNNVQL